MKNRKYYENLFADYPSVVTLTQFRGMLGGIGDSTEADERKSRETLLHPHDLSNPQGLGD